jgi:enoyl-CoA hydratase/carnithine racemase
MVLASGHFGLRRPTTSAYPPWRIRTGPLQTLSVRREGGVLFVNIAAPPLNLIEPELVGDLVTFIQQAESDDAVRVIVFKSADPDYFIAHVDVTRVAE